MKYKGGIKMNLSTIVITLVLGFVLLLFNVELVKLSEIIRSNPFESFVVVGLCIVIAILYKGTFL